ncbi:hypothetical protein RRG08_061818 [Elysia crispata]|uniref:Uncharacterized protein n=1 Tax=Elysia crispata TaxID=231223 RepID=A0AAE1A2N4_9GAST|nr:hypothetical protein RRG08_061818 [Elysia crispata]
MILPASSKVVSMGKEFNVRRKFKVRLEASRTGRCRRSPQATSMLKSLAFKQDCIRFKNISSKAKCTCCNNAQNTLRKVKEVRNGQLAAVFLENQFVIT